MLDALPATSLTPKDMGRLGDGVLLANPDSAKTTHPCKESQPSARQDLRMIALSPGFSGQMPSPCRVSAILVVLLWYIVSSTSILPRTS